MKLLSLLQNLSLLETFLDNYTVGKKLRKERISIGVYSAKQSLFVIPTDFSFEHDIAVPHATLEVSPGTIFTSFWSIYYMLSSKQPSDAVQLIKFIWLLYIPPSLLSRPRAIRATGQKAFTVLRILITAGVLFSF